MKLELGIVLMLALLPPRGQMGRIQPFPAQEHSDFARLRAGLGLLQDATLVVSRELSPLRLEYDFGVRNRRWCG